MTPVDVVFGLAVLAVSVFFALSTLTRGRWRTSSRVALVGGFTDVVVVLLIGRLLLPWSIFTPWAWLLPVAIVAAGVVGAVLRWNELPIWRADRPRWRAIVASVLRAAIVILVAVLVFWP